MFGTYSSLRLLSPRTNNFCSFNKISPISFTYANHTTQNLKTQLKVQGEPRVSFVEERDEEGDAKKKGNV